MNVTDKIVSRIPIKNFNGKRAEKVLNWFGKHISTPENRLIIGISALASQPFIDLHNKKVDEKTRIISCARTVAKIVSGTILGVGVRAGLIRLAKKCSSLNKTDSKLKRLFTPSSPPKTMTYSYKQYQNAMGMLLAVGALLFTNFLIDAPLTALLTNTFTKKFENASRKEKNNEIS